MILIAEAVVDKGAMMVVTLDALIAIVTMHTVLGMQVFTIDAYVVHVEVLIH